MLEYISELPKTGQFGKSRRGLRWKRIWAAGGTTATRPDAILQASAGDETGSLYPVNLSPEESCKVNANKINVKENMDPNPKSFQPPKPSQIPTSKGGSTTDGLLTPLQSASTSLKGVKTFSTYFCLALSIT